MDEMQKLIQQALNQDVDLSEEEYREKILNADKITAGHGATKKAAVTESVRHKRVQRNFYGIALNFLSSLLGEMATLSTLVRQQNAMLYELLKEKGIDVDKLFKR